MNLKVKVPRIKISKKIIQLDVVLAIIILLWMNVGAYTVLQRFVPSFIPYGCYIVWLIIAVRNYNFIGRFSKLFASFMIPFTIFLLSYIMYSSGTVYNFLITMYYAFMILSIAITYIDLIHIRRIIIFVLALDIVIVLLNTMFHLFTNPMIIRYMSTTADARAKLLGKPVYAVAKYSIIICLVLLACLIFNQLMKYKTRRFMLTFAFLIIVYIVFKSQLAIIISSLIVGIVIQIIMSSRLLSQNKAILSLLLIIVSLTLYLVLPLALNVVLKAGILPELLEVKAYDVLMLYDGDINNLNDMDVRLEQYSKSIGMFMESPLIGVLGNSTEVGGHATWLDTFALFGVLCLPYIAFYLKSYKYFIRRLSNKYRDSVVGLYLTYMLIGLLNPIVFSNTFVMTYVIIPFMVIEFEKRQQYETVPN